MLSSPSMQLRSRGSKSGHQHLDKSPYLLCHVLACQNSVGVCDVCGGAGICVLTCTCGSQRTTSSILLHPHLILLSKVSLIYYCSTG